MAKFTIVVRCDTLKMQSAWSALRFCETAIASGHHIERVFFQGDGVYAALANRAIPQNESDPMNRWQALAETSGVPMVVCVSSALKRGIFDSREAQRYQREATMAPFMEIGGLGQLVEASAIADRVVCFHD